MKGALLRLGLRCGYALATVYWRLRRPRCHGAHVALWVGERLLLVRLSYRSRLAFPGGGVHRGEAVSAAARRELREELGLEIREEELGPPLRFVCAHDGRRDHCEVFTLRRAVLPPLRPDGFEIIGFALHDADELRDLSLTPPVRTYLDLVGIPS